MSQRWMTLMFCALVLVLLAAPSAHASGSWSTTVDIDGSNGLTGVSCVPSNWCVAVDKEGDALYRSGGTWSAPTSIGPYSLNGVSCVTSSFCAAVDNNGNALIYRGSSWSSTHVDTDSSTALSAVSCGSTTLCMAVDGDGNAFRYNGTSWAASLFTQDGDPYEGVSCILSGFCLAVSDQGYRAYNGTWSTKGTIDGGGAHGISCVSSSFCVAADASGNAYIYNGSSWSAPTFIDGSSPLDLVLSCPSSSFCVAADFDGNAMIFNGSSWTAPANVNGGTGAFHALYAVSCGSISFCVAVGSPGNEVTYTANPGAQAWGTRVATANIDAARADVFSTDSTKLFVTGESNGGMLTTAYRATDGMTLWSRNFTTGTSAGKAITISPDGSKVFVTGSSLGANANDYVTIAYDSATGNRVWLQRFDSTAHEDDIPAAITVSPDGSKVYVTGTSVGASSNDDYATIAYNATTGAQLWIMRFNSTANSKDDAAAIGVSPDGSKVFVTGQSIASSSGWDYATQAYNASTGARLWAVRYSGSGEDQASSLGVSPDGSKVYVTGITAGSVGFYDQTLALDAGTGATIWSKQYGSPLPSDAYHPSLAVGHDGTKVFVTNATRGASSLDFGTVAYAASSGAQLWAATYNGPANNDDEATAIAGSADGSRVFVTGPSAGSGTGKDDATLAYDAYSGNLLWTRRNDGPGHADDIPAGIAVSPDSARVAIAAASAGSSTGADWQVLTFATG